jgi:hypothetical protein
VFDVGYQLHQCLFCFHRLRNASLDVLSLPYEALNEAFHEDFAVISHHWRGEPVTNDQRSDLLAEVCSTLVSIGRSKCANFDLIFEEVQDVLVMRQEIILELVRQILDGMYSLESFQNRHQILSRTFAAGKHCTHVLDQRPNVLNGLI